MTSLQGAIKWSHKGIRYYADKILIFILVKEIVLFTGKSPLKAPFLISKFTNDSIYHKIYAFKKHVNKYAKNTQHANKELS